MDTLPERRARRALPVRMEPRLLNDAAATATLMKKELPGLTDSAGKTLNGLATVTGQLTAEDGQRLKLALERFTAAGAQLEQIAARADRVLAQIEAGLRFEPLTPNPRGWPSPLLDV